MNRGYKLLCMSYDGDFVIEDNRRDNFKTVADAWKFGHDMGSRWFFFPFWFVTGATGKMIVDAPNGLERFRGKRVSTVTQEFKSLSELPEMQNVAPEEFDLALQSVTGRCP